MTILVTWLPALFDANSARLSVFHQNRIPQCSANEVWRIPSFANAIILVYTSERERRGRRGIKGMSHDGSSLARETLCYENANYRAHSLVIGKKSENPTQYYFFGVIGVSANALFYNA